MAAESFGAALQYFTGSKDHNVVLRGMAKALGLKINEYGVFRDDRQIAGRTEEEVYAAVGLPWIPPELREARREFEWAAAGTLPHLVELGDLRGDLHMHTNWSDGDRVHRRDGRGRPASRAEVHRHHRPFEAERDRQRTGCRAAPAAMGGNRSAAASGPRELPCSRAWKSISSRPADWICRMRLAQADWVVASVHFGQKQSRERITRRILDALENPYVSAIAHPRAGC